MRKAKSHFLETPDEFFYKLFFNYSNTGKDMPTVFGKDSKKKDLIKNIGNIYDRLQREHQISPGDFPDIKKMQEVLQNQDFSKFHSLKPHKHEQGFCTKNTHKSSFYDEHNVNIF